MKRLLDLFCGAGGAGMGYHRAGFEVVGVDIAFQKHYPFEFHQADALEYLAEHGEEFDAIHASPPCQEYSASVHIRKANPQVTPIVRAKLIEPVERSLRQIGKPWVIENVIGSPMASAIVLCGSMFGLPLLRHRSFMASILLFAAGPCKHPGAFYNVLGGGVEAIGTLRNGAEYEDRNGNKRLRAGNAHKADGEKAMGIDWMNLREMSEAIPPAYAEYIGSQIMRTLVEE